MSQPPATPHNNAPLGHAGNPLHAHTAEQTPEDAVVFDAQDEALLANIGAALSEERQAIQAHSARFQAKLLTKVNAGASRRISARNSRVIRPNNWTRHLKYYAAAVLFIGLTLGLLAVSGVLGTPGMPNMPAPSMRVARLQADPIPLNMNSGETAASDLFKAYDNQQMKLVIDTQDGEACLSLIPQAAIDRDYDALQKEALLRHPNWDVTVEAGRITLPAQAYSQAIGTANRVVLLKIAGHYEIWTAEALQRYVERNQKNPDVHGELPGRLDVDRVRG